MIAVAMSGGVDSAVTAALLKKEEPSLLGVFMILGQADQAAQIARVKNIARFLDIPLELVDLTEAFRRQVLDYFHDSYHQGLTPNPCAVCNRDIKCGRLLQILRERGIEKMATGHYARIGREAGAGVKLRRGLDAKKDQSYFLARLQPEQLAGLHFPLGAYTKQEVYRLAADLGLAGLHARESQDICFLAGQSLVDFMRASGRPEVQGPIVTLDGRTLGRHAGIHHFTVGQRHGLGLPDATPYYVVRLEPEGNRVVVGKNEDLLQLRLTVAELNWLGGAEPLLPQDFEVKIRSRHHAALATVDRLSDATVSIVFSEAQRAVTPGQIAVFYRGDEVVGSGVIQDKGIRQ